MLVETHVTQHHHAAEQQRGGVGQVHAGDVGGGAVNLVGGREINQTHLVRSSGRRADGGRLRPEAAAETHRLEYCHSVSADVAAGGDAEPSDQSSTQVAEATSTMGRERLTHTGTYTHR